MQIGADCRRRPLPFSDGVTNTSRNPIRMQKPQNNSDCIGAAYANEQLNGSKHWNNCTWMTVSRIEPIPSNRYWNCPQSIIYPSNSNCCHFFNKVHFLKCRNRRWFSVCKFMQIARVSREISTRRFGWFIDLNQTNFHKIRIVVIFSTKFIFWNVEIGPGFRYANLCKSPRFQFSSRRLIGTIIPINRFLISVIPTLWVFSTEFIFLKRGKCVKHFRQRISSEIPFKCSETVVEFNSSDKYWHAVAIIKCFNKVHFSERGKTCKTTRNPVCKSDEWNWLNNIISQPWKINQISFNPIFITAAV